MVEQELDKSKVKNYADYLLKSFQKARKTRETEAKVHEHISKVREAVTSPAPSKIDKDALTLELGKLERVIKEMILNHRLMIDKEQLILNKQTDEMEMISKVYRKTESEKASEFDVSKISKSGLSPEIKHLLMAVKELSKNMADLKKISSSVDTMSSYTKEVDSMKDAITNLNLKVSALMKDELAMTEGFKTFENGIEGEINNRKEEFEVIEKQIQLLERKFELISKTESISPERLRQVKTKIDLTKKKLIQKRKK